MAHTLTSRLTATGAVVAAGALLLTGCGSSKISGNSGAAPNASASVSAVTADPSLAAMVPAALKSKGTVTIATDSTYAPAEFKDASGKIVGFDIDLGDAIFAKLGLKTTWQSADFGSIIGGIAAKKYDLSLSSFTDTKEREKTIDLVQYYNAGEAIATLAGNPDKVPSTANDLCGFKVAVQTNTTESDEIKNTINPGCKKAGKPEIPNNGDQFDAQSDATSALISKRDQAMLADSPVVDYAVKQNSSLMKLGENYNVAPYGIALPKGTQLTQAVQAAVKALIQDGTYGQILNKWGVQSGAITADKVLINAAAS